MIKHSLLILLFFSSNLLFAQTGKIELKTLKPVYETNQYPEIFYAANPKIAEKINTFLQLEDLEHLPNVFQKHPFEKVCYDEQANRGSISFESWKQFKTTKNILSFSVSGDATGAYSENFEAYHNFDLSTGDPVILKTLFTKTGTAQLEKLLNKKVEQRITSYLKANQPPEKTEGTVKQEDDDIGEQISMYNDCLNDVKSNTLEWYKFYFSQDSITFVRGRCSNHALRALDDLDNYFITFSFRELSSYLSLSGKQLLNDSKNLVPLSSPEGKMFRGKINDKYPVSLIISKIYEDGSLRLKYWYDKVKTPIEWRGKFENNHFSLVEDDYHSEELKAWVPRANIEADWRNGNKITGTWINYTTKEVLKVELSRY